MKPDVQIINPLNYPEWDALLISCPGCTFFHSSAWARVLNETYGYKPVYFVVFNNGSICAVIPIMGVNSRITGRRGVSLPFSDYCEPICSDGICFQDIWKTLIDYGKRQGWKYIELRGGGNFFSKTAPSYCYYDHVLNLNLEEEKVFSKFRDSTNRNVKRAVREGVEVKISNALNSVKEFYRLNCMTRKRHSLPPQPFYFFKKVYEHIISKNLGFVVLASYENCAIAGAVFFHLGEKALFKYGGSDKNFHQLRPNNLVMWEAIRWYCENGYKSLSFGKTEPENHGLMQFKSGWGTTEHQINYYRYDFKMGTFVSGSSRCSGFPNRVFRRIPLPLLKRVGSVIYKHFA